MLRMHADETPSKYNFVLTGNRLIITKINVGSRYTDWVLSKHVLMSNYSEGVRYAGEIWKSTDGTLHFNNNSGIYKPGALNIDPVRGLFEILFPGVKIQGHGLGG